MLLSSSTYRNLSNFFKTELVFATYTNPATCPFSNARLLLEELSELDSHAWFDTKMSDGSVHIYFSSSTDLHKLWCDFVKNVERIFHRHAPHVTESSFCAQLAHFRLCYTGGTKTFTVMSERRGHAVENATAVEEGAQQTQVLLQLI